MTARREPIRVLFVDDEAHILAGLERVLRRQMGGWSMAFANGGEDALARLAKDPADVIVSDMQMPGMDGAALMQEVRRRHPEVVRLILTCHSNPGMILRAVLATHQFLVKPCCPEDLIRTVEGTMEPRRRVGGVAMCRRIGLIDSLPSPSKRLRQLRTALRRPSVSPAELGQIIREDPAMSVRVVQLCNSVYGQGRLPVTDPSEAVARVGVELIHSLEKVPLFHDTVPGSLDLEAWAQHSLETARFARGIAERAEMDLSSTGLVYLAGLLHDLGDLMEPDGMKVGGATEGPSRSGSAAGDYFLALWGFSSEMRAAIRGVHEPGNDTGEDAVRTALLGGHELARRMSPAGREELSLPPGGNRWVQRCQHLWARRNRSSGSEENTDE